MNGNRAAKDAGCFYLIHFDRPIDGYWAGASGATSRRLRVPRTSWRRWASGKN